MAVHAVPIGVGGEAEGAGAAGVVELQAGDIRWDFFVGQHEAEHGDGTGQCEVIRLLGVGYHEVAVVVSRSPPLPPSAPS